MKPVERKLIGGGGGEARNRRVHVAAGAMRVGAAGR